MHLSQHDYQRYDLEDLTACRESTAKFTHKKELHKTLGMIQDNEFAVGHIRHGRKNIDRLSGFKKIILLRDYEAIKESAERWKSLSGRNVNPKSLIHLAEEIEKWQDEKDVYVLWFRNMVNKNVIAIDKLQIYLFGSIKYDSEKAISAALAKDSLTKSDIRK